MTCDPLHPDYARAREWWAAYSAGYQDGWAEGYAAALDNADDDVPEMSRHDEPAPG